MSIYLFFYIESLTFVTQDLQIKLKDNSESLILGVPFAKIACNVELKAFVLMEMSIVLFLSFIYVICPLFLMFLMLF